MKRKLFLIVAFISVTTFAQIVNIPDANFKQALVQGGIDTNNDGEIQVSEAQAITALFVDGRHIDDLTGIESFINLTSLSCNNNNITNLDVSNLTKLTSLHCQENELTNLNVTGLTTLYGLYCRSNRLTSLDVSTLAELRNLDCRWNEIESLDTASLPELRDIDCSHNDITELDFSQSTKLVEIFCEGNKLPELDLSNCNKINKLYCRGNRLTYLNIKNGRDEPTLHFGENPDLEFICADETQTDYVQNLIDAYNYTSTCKLVTDCSEALSTDNYISSFNFNLYPNPVTNILTFNTDENIIKVEVYNLTGKNILSSKIFNNKLDLTNIKKGIYILKTYTNKGIVISKLLKE